jgi:alginate O-acetyltransferase complex protein AlgI
MLFPSPVFLFLFLPFVLAAYYLLPKRFQNILLLLASLFFYAWGEGIYLIVLLLIILLNYSLALLIPKSRFWLITAIITNLLFIIYFKYLVFFLIIITKPLGSFGLNIPIDLKIHMPLGISFIVFHAISYVIDVYRKKIKAEKNILNFALYMCLFPHLIAGPIVRYADIGTQIKKRKTDITMFSEGVRRFIIGLGKKMIIANNMAYIADKIFAIFPQYLSSDILWLGLLAYTFQIYFDFSGYSDMAIGLAKMFGFNFAENFNYPYISKSIQEFWRRWHMTLSSWFRDYLYIPLGGNRKGIIWTNVNILIVFLLTGLWHGASWHYVFWGFYYGVFLIIENLFLRKVLGKIWSPFAHFYTLIVVIIGWLFFRVESLSYGLYLLKVLFGMEGPKNPTYNIWMFLNTQIILTFIIAILIATPIFNWFANKYLKTNFNNWFVQYIRLSFLVLIFLYSIMQLSSDTYNPFIYFRF